jgi:aspartyl-tRNA(Asn)/glutamyl-tRNA(Gln) amidotransferase subunit A
MNDSRPVTGDPSFLSAAVLGRELAEKRLSPVDATDALLARISALDPKLHAFVSVYGASARLAAEAADKAIRSGHAVGPLHGVPIALKDLIEIEGEITTGGSANWRNRRSPVTATLVRRLLAQGMIVLGKTHTVEFAFGAWGTNLHMGTPWNPWDPTVARTPGGSSSGSAVAVAARMAPWAIGTDTGGSIRVPASWCGLTGLKVTFGRISTFGIMPLSTSLDTPGPLTRSVVDTALLYNVLQGPDPLDPATRGIAPDDPFPTLARGVSGLRIARMPAAEREGVAPTMLEAYDRSLGVLSNLGAEIVDISLPFRFVDCVNAHTIMQAEAYFHCGSLAQDTTLQLDPVVRRRVLGGAGISAQDYLATRKLQREFKQAFYRALDGVDALLTPSTETAAIPLDAVDQSSTPTRFTRFGNLLELCALALPNGFTEEGLPLSLEIVCRSFDEAMALRIGHALQQATDWHLRTPPGIG